MKTQTLSQKTNLPKFSFIAILVIFVGFSTTYSLYTPSWEESDGWFHWSYTRAVAESNLDPAFYHRQQPLYYFINGGILTLLDPSILEDTSPPHTKRNMFEDLNYYRHTTEDDFQFGKSNFQRGCVGICTDFEEEFPYTGIALGVHSLRLISILYGVVSLVFIYKTTQIVFKKNKWLPIYSTAFVAFIPHFIFINSVLGGTSLTILFVTLSIYFLVKLVFNPTKITNLILLGVFVGLGLLTKVQVAFLLPTVYFTFFYLLYTKNLEKKIFLKYAGIFSAVFIIFGGWWHLFQFSFITYFFQSLILDIPSATGAGSAIFEKAGEMTYEKIIHNLTNHERWHLIYFDTVWTGVGWKRISAHPIFTYLVKFFLIPSLIGLFLFWIKRSKNYFPVEKKFLVVLFMIIIFETASMMSIKILFDLGSGRNLLPASSAFAIFVIIGLFYFTKRKNLTPILLIPIGILFLTNINLFFEMDEKYEHGLPRNPILDSNRFLLTEMWLGESSGVQGNEPISKIRTANLEGGWRDTVLLLHPPKEGIKFWNFTMTIPDNESYEIEIKYGFMSNAMLRSEPVEFSTYIDGELIFQDEKTFTWNPETIKIKIGSYDKNKVQVALATDAKDKGNYLAWSFFKLKFVQ